MITRLPILDAVQHHREHPATFPIPTRAERARVRKRDLAKLVFELPELVDLGSGCEPPSSAAHSEIGEPGRI